MCITGKRKCFCLVATHWFTRNITRCSFLSIWHGVRVHTTLSSVPIVVCTHNTLVTFFWCSSPTFSRDKGAHRLLNYNLRILHISFPLSTNHLPLLYYMFTMNQGRWRLSPASTETCETSQSSHLFRKGVHLPDLPVDFLLMWLMRHPNSFVFLHCPLPLFTC